MQFKNKFLISLVGCFISANSFAALPIVVIGGNGTILSSPDGSKWTPHATDAKYLESVTHGDQYIALGNNGQDFLVTSSQDGINWTSTDQGSLDWSPNFDVIWHDNQYLSIDVQWGDIYTSSTGLNWKMRYDGYPDNYTSIAASDGAATQMFAAVSGVMSDHTCTGTVVISSDSVTWNKVNQSFPCFGNANSWGSEKNRLHAHSKDPIYTVTKASITWGKNQFVATGQKGGRYDTYEAGFLTSPDSQNWTWKSVGPMKSIAKVIFANNMFVAVGQDETTGNGLVFTSTDGVNWNTKTIDTTNRLHSIGWVNNLFVAVGNNGYIATSPDAIHWTQQESGISEDLVGVA